MEDPARVRLRHKQWRERNKDRIRAYDAKFDATHPNYRRDYERKRRKLDPAYALACGLRTRLNNALHGKAKNGSATELLGCSIKEFRQHIESLWLPGMNWTNYGRLGWHIDHKIPLSAVDLTNIDHLKKVCHYTNLQPLWAKDNLDKRAVDRHVKVFSD